MLPHPLNLLGPRATIMSGKPVADAIEHLKSRYVVSVEGAVNNLNRRLDRVRLLGLYYEIFPAQFLASRASWTTAREADREAAEFNWGDEARAHTEREMEFLELVNRELFELPLEWIEQGTRLDQIMFYSPFNGWEEDGEPDRFKPALQLAGAFLTDNNWITTAHVIGLLTGEVDPDKYYQHTHYAPECDLSYSHDESLIPVTIPSDARLKFWTTYERLIGQQAPPVSYMNDAINLMACNTGITAFDVSCMCGNCGQEFEWTRENVDAFAAEHKQGLDLFNRVDELDEWLKLDPAAHVAELVVLWNYAAHHAGLIELTPVPRESQLSFFNPN